MHNVMFMQQRYKGRCIQDTRERVTRNNDRS